MEVTASQLLSYILDLLGDSSKADAFAADPSGALAAAGLGDISCADVDALTPLIANAAGGAVAIAGVGGGTPGEAITHLVKNVAIANHASRDFTQNIWAEGDVRQAFASEGGFAVGGDLLTNDPVIVGDGNLVATDEAQAAGRDIIQNNGDGNMTLGGDQTNNLAPNTGNHIGGNQNNAENTGNDNSVTIGGNNNAAENTGNDNSVGGDYWEDGSNVGGIGNTDDHSTTITVGDIDLSDHSINDSGNTTISDSGNTTVDDHSVGGDYWEDGSNVGGIGNTTISDSGNTTVDDHSTTITVGDVDLSDHSINDSGNTTTTVDDHSVGGDYWEDGSNVGGIGNTDNRNSNNTADSGNTVVIDRSVNEDNSISVGTIAVDRSQTNSVGGDYHETGSNVGGIGNSTVETTVTVDDNSTTTIDDNSTVTVDDHSVGGDYHETGSNVGGIGNSTADTTVTVDDNSTSYQGDFYESGSAGGNYYESGSAGGNYYESGAGAVEPVVTEPVATTYDYDYTFGG